MERKVTYIKIIGILFLLGALFILGVSFVIGLSINTISGGVALIVAIFLYLTNAAFVYNDDEISHKNLFGSTLKTYSFKTDKISVQNRTIYVNGNKVRVSASMLVRSEYDTLIAHILTKSNDSEMPGKTAQPKTDDNILDSELIGK